MLFFTGTHVVLQSSCIWRAAGTFPRSPACTCRWFLTLLHVQTNKEFKCFYSLLLTSVGASAARTGLTRQPSVLGRCRGHKGWDHGHTAEVSEDADLAAHTPAWWHDADKVKNKGWLTLRPNWIFIKYLWMSSSEWREESMPCKDWWKKRGEQVKTQSKCAEKKWQREGGLEKERPIKQNRGAMETNQS